MAVLAAAAGLADVAPLARGLLGDRLLVGDLRLADVGADVELAHQAVDDDLEVQLAHAGDDGLARVLVRVDAEGRIFLHQLGRATCRASPGRTWSSARSTTAITGSGKFIDSSTTGCLGSQMVSPVVTFFRPTAAAMSPAQTSSISSRLLACILSRRPMRSLCCCASS